MTFSLPGMHAYYLPAGRTQRYAACRGCYHTRATYVLLLPYRADRR